MVAVPDRQYLIPQDYIESAFAELLEVKAIAFEPMCK